MADYETIEFLTTERDVILDAALGDVTSRHYAAAGAVEVRRRLESLFDCVLESIDTRDLSAIVGHAQQIAEERFRMGYDLSEVQAAFGRSKQRPGRACSRPCRRIDSQARWASSRPSSVRAETRSRGHTSRWRPTTTRRLSTSAHCSPAPPPERSSG